MIGIQVSLRWLPRSRPSLSRVKPPFNAAVLTSNFRDI